MQQDSLCAPKAWKSKQIITEVMLFNAKQVVGLLLS